VYTENVETFAGDAGKWDAVKCLQKLLPGAGAQVGDGALVRKSFGRIGFGRIGSGRIGFGRFGFGRIDLRFCETNRYL
jgi:hypothetical protein